MSLAIDCFCLASSSWTTGWNVSLGHLNANAMARSAVLPKLFHVLFQGPVARSLVSSNRWLRGIKMYRFSWYLTLVSTNHASSNPGQMVKPYYVIHIPFSPYCLSQRCQVKCSSLFICIQCNYSHVQKNKTTTVNNYWTR